MRESVNMLRTVNGARFNVMTQHVDVAGMTSGSYAASASEHSPGCWYGSGVDFFRCPVRPRGPRRWRPIATLTSEPRQMRSVAALTQVMVVATFWRNRNTLVLYAGPPGPGEHAYDFVPGACH